MIKQKAGHIVRPDTNHSRDPSYTVDPDQHLVCRWHGWHGSHEYVPSSVVACRTELPTSRLQCFQSGAHLAQRVIAIRTRPPVQRSGCPNLGCHCRTRADTFVLHCEALPEPAVPLLCAKPSALRLGQGCHPGDGRAALPDDLSSVLRQLRSAVAAGP